jgi:hypothetical protein
VAVVPSLTDVREGLSALSNPENVLKNCSGRLDCTCHTALRFAD